MTVQELLRARPPHLDLLKNVDPTGIVKVSAETEKRMTRRMLVDLLAERESEQVQVEFALAHRSEKISSMVLDLIDRIQSRRNLDKIVEGFRYLYQ